MLPAGEPLMPPPHKMYASYALRAVFFVGLFVQIFGSWGAPPPPPPPSRCERERVGRIRNKGRENPE